MDILVVLPVSFERNLQHFHLVAQRLSVHRTTTWWFRSAGYQCFTLLKLARGHRNRHDRTLSWSRWNYDRAPTDVPSAFPPTAWSSIYFQLYSPVIWNRLVLLPRSVLPGLIACRESLAAWLCSGDKSSICRRHRSVILKKSCVAFLRKRNNQWLCPVFRPLSTGPNCLTYDGQVIDDAWHYVF